MHAFHPVLLILYDGDGDGVNDSNSHGTSRGGRLRQVGWLCQRQSSQT